MPAPFVRPFVAVAQAVTVMALVALPAAPAAATSFNRADRNQDGGVSYEEARRALPRVSRIHFDRMDRNGDAHLSRGEYASLSDIYSLFYEN